MSISTRRLVSVLAGALALLFLFGTGFAASPASADHCDVATNVPPDCPHDPCLTPQAAAVGDDPCQTTTTTSPPRTVPRDEDTPPDEIPTTTVTEPEPDDAEVESIQEEAAPAVLPRTGAAVTTGLLASLGFLGAGVAMLRSARRKE